MYKPKQPNALFNYSRNVFDNNFYKKFVLWEKYAIHNCHCWKHASRQTKNGSLDSFGKSINQISHDIQLDYAQYDASIMRMILQHH